MFPGRSDASHIVSTPVQRAYWLTPERISKAAKPMTKDKQKAEVLKGWTAIAKFLGQPVTVVQRWGTEGMPVTKEGRFVHADPEELTNWVGTESGKRKPVRIASESENLASDLKQALSYVRCHRKGEH